MSDGTIDTWRVWHDLRRKEATLTWNGPQPGSGSRYDSMGRPAHLSSQFGGWGRAQAGRVDRVRQALDASGPIAQRLLAERLAGIDLSSVWHLLLSACRDIALYYGGSVVVGGVIGGFGGAFFGGVGALPGAAAGAAAGGYLGGAVMSLLGLKSLVEGLADAIPAALHCYEDGFLKAWGPGRRDNHAGLDLGGGGNTALAALDLANGHVIMILAILTAIMAYLGRGKGNRVALMNDIRSSPRLGPRFASWMEQNEARLRKHPALQSRRSGALPHEEPAPPASKSGQSAKSEHEGGAPKGMPPKKVPCFTTKGLPQGDVPEFDRQLGGQEAGINDMTVEEYVKGREAFEAGESVRSQTVARDARATYRQALEEDLYTQLREQGLSNAIAEEKSAEMAAAKMKTLAALHNPDMVSAGKDVISDFGNRNINSRIGAQWKKGMRLSELDKAAQAIPASMRSRTKMNAKLERCK